MKKYFLVFIFPFQVISINAQENQSAKKTEKELINISQELMNAVAVGDKEIWNKYLDEHYLVTTEDGKVKNKTQIIDELAPLPKGFKGSIEVVEPKVINMGNIAIIKFIAKEYEEVFDRKINTKYAETDTYIRKGGKWKLIASQIMELNAVPNPIKINKELLKAYEGKYQLTSEIIYTISVEGDKVYGQRGNRAREELIPGGDGILFKPGSRIIKLFEKDEKGNVIRMLDRRNGNDLIWKRIKHEK